jgi:lipopolysaccharide biosynthesis glycosyltransferase
MKKDNLVLTISIGDYYKNISSYTLPFIRAYAKKVNADFLNIDEFDKHYITQKWNKFHIHELLNQYKRILYLDIDLIIRDDCPNLFDIVPETKLGMFDEGKYTPRYEFLEQASEYYKEPLKKWNGKFYNSGVMVISRKHKSIFKLPKGYDFVETDQPYINLRILNDKIEMFDLDFRFNRMDILDKHCGISRLDSYIVHYAGAPKEMIFDVLTKDIEQWRMDHPKYEYKRNILISVSAGMGDQLCSEPAIRFTQKLYPDTNIFVVTHFPRLFEHLSVPVYNYDEWKGINDALITMHTCPDDDHSEHKLSHVLFHPTDFASMSMVKRTIPNIDKTIKLKLSVDDVSYVISLLQNKNPKKPTIIVHAGKWWPSKTLPLEWWQEIVNKLSEKITVVLIGKSIDEKQGYLPIELPEDGIDLRDLTTLGELLSLISLSKCLLTNDSSPLHIAGAFDNWIVTIPTSKHPDHILPFRNSTQYYKTKALYKKLLLDDLEIRHTEFHTNTIDTIPEGKTLYDYIPDVDTVVKEVFEIYDIEYAPKFEEELINEQV